MEKANMLMKDISAPVSVKSSANFENINQKKSLTSVNLSKNAGFAPKSSESIKVQRSEKGLDAI